MIMHDIPCTVIALIVADHIAWVMPVKGNTVHLWLTLKETKERDTHYVLQLFLIDHYRYKHIFFHYIINFIWQYAIEFLWNKDMPGKIRMLSSIKMSYGHHLISNIFIRWAKDCHC